MSVHWQCYPDARAAAEASARHIVALLDNGQAHASLAVSGGSTPKLLFEALAKSKLSRFARSASEWLAHQNTPWIFCLDLAVLHVSPRRPSRPLDG